MDDIQCYVGTLMVYFGHNNEENLMMLNNFLKGSLIKRDNALA